MLSILHVDLFGRNMRLARVVQQAGWHTGFPCKSIGEGHRWRRLEVSHEAARIELSALQLQKREAAE
jgi:hypothetical protein